MRTFDVGIKLREARHRAGLSQREAAQKSGVGHGSISSFESGNRLQSLKIRHAEALCRAYGLTMREFFGGELDDAISAERHEVIALDQFNRAELEALSRVLTLLQPFGIDRAELLLRFVLGRQEIQHTADKIRKEVAAHHVN
jgi:transcriptional regulator with XRE-family HTH domain